MSSLGGVAQIAFPPVRGSSELLGLPAQLSASRLLRAVTVGGALLFVGAAATQGPVTGLTAVAAVGVFLGVAARPLAGAYTLIALAPLTSGLGRGLPIPAFRFSELLIAGVAGTILLTVQRSESRPWRLFDWTALLYVIAAFVLGMTNFIARRDSPTIDELSTLAGPLQFLLLYRAVYTVLRDSDHRRYVPTLIVLASVPASLLAILQGLDIGPSREIVDAITQVDLTSDFSFERLARATGPFPLWHALAGYLLVVILIGVGSLTSRPGPPARVPVVIALVPAAIALALTASIAPIFGTVAGCLIIILWPRRTGAGAHQQSRSKVLVWAVGAALFAAIVSFPVLKDRYALQFDSVSATNEGPTFVPQTVAFRYDVWTTQYAPEIAKHWVTGYGPDLPPSITWRYTESLYLTLLLRGGVPLLLVYVALMVAAVLMARPISRSPDPVARTFARVLIATVIVLIPMHAVIPYFINAGLPHMFWIVAAVAASAGTTAERRRAPSATAWPDGKGQLHPEYPGVS